ncbi:1-deoxy-D-xylulose-5-phosphate reductoisomerase [Spiroplasma culicicola]|uniref:1-deoxy-D-xylulose 5-phosphate reductoisomerase n=1 Tax=Spiroplasma culicicola AES-1 TaxID=1276246 RepID=W6A7W8_9MOLU|nr:1-deoxy-D-xylulose-5-phosphate reductoisomerase [Spiroplasma culicicola]AHI53086.1 1-deoxy-D-xylulose 5-phosphate reductoisomerase [Spiroplasma culicicola AES-1]
MKNIILFGASGNIGVQTIEILKENKDNFNLKAISIGKNDSLVESFLKEFENIEMVYSTNNLAHLKEKYENITFINDDILKLFTVKHDLTINALSGFFGLKVTLAAIEQEDILLNANKESFVVAGDLINQMLAKAKKAQIYPIDSEHCAIFQCLEENNSIERILLTASGGNFKDLTLEDTKSITLKTALKHPNWNMGAKITIDSSTMFNKAFEILEAYHLFKSKNIDVLIHPQSLVHSMVEFKDGSIKAQISIPDMKQVINYFLHYPKRTSYNALKMMDFKQLVNLEFKAIDQERFIPIKLAYECIDKGNSKAIALNAANEIAVEYFLEEKLSYFDITQIVLKIFNSTDEITYNNYEQMFEFDQKVRNQTRKMIEEVM